MERLCPVCQRAYNKLGMICCNSCQSWVHYKCVAIANFTDAMAKRSTFVCPPCMQSAVQQGDSTPSDLEYFEPNAGAVIEPRVEGNATSSHSRAEEVINEITNGLQRMSLVIEGASPYVNVHSTPIVPRQPAPVDLRVSNAAPTPSNAPGAHSTVRDLPYPIRDINMPQPRGGDLYGWIFQVQPSSMVQPNSVIDLRTMSVERAEYVTPTPEPYRPQPSRSVPGRSMATPKPPNTTPIPAPPAIARNHTTAAGVPPPIPPRTRVIPNRQNVANASTERAPAINVVTYDANVKREPLPRFDGTQPDSWVALEAIYLRNRNSGRSDDNLFVDLAEAVAGEARKIVASDFLVRSSPDDIMRKLKRFYGNAYEVLDRIVREIETSKPPRTLPKSELRTFAIKLDSLVTTARAFNATDYIRQPMLCERVSSMLEDTHRDWWHHEKRRRPNADLSSIAEFLLEKCLEPSYAQASKTSKAPKAGKSTKAPKREDRMYLHRTHSDDEDDEDEREVYGTYLTTTSQSNTDKEKARESPNPDEQKPESKMKSSDTKSDSQKKEDRKKDEKKSENPRPMSCFYCGEPHLLRLCTKFQSLQPLERRRWVAAVGVCSSCLGTKAHKWADCPTRRVCKATCKCQRHELLHIESPVLGGQQSTSTDAVARTMVHESQGKTLYKILPVVVRVDGGREKTIYAFIDLGSNRTLMDQSLYDELGIKGMRELLRLKWTQGIQTADAESFTCGFEIRGIGSNAWHYLNDVSTVRDLDLPKQTLDMERLSGRYPHLQRVPAPSYENVRPLLLIGLPHSKHCEGRRLIEGADNEPLAQKTPLGWVIYGSTSRVAQATTSATHLCIRGNDDNLWDRAERYFLVDSVGVSMAREVTNDEERKAKETANRTFRFTGERYEVGLLWSDDNVQLPNNYVVAKRRLELLEKSLHRRPELLEWVDERINTMLTNGHARVLSEEEVRAPRTRIWYLPIFVTFNPNKSPPKPRLVHDAAAEYRGVSLNHRLLKGPDLLTSLLGGIFRMRERMIAVTGDVEEMYYQVAIPEEDQHVLRFLWRGGRADHEPKTHVMTVMPFGVACASFCTQYVKNRHAEKFAETQPQVHASIIRDMYVDDHTKSYDSPDEAAALTNQVIDALQEGGFRLRNIQSNCPKTLSCIPADRVSPAMIGIDLSGDQPVSVKFLGLQWDAVSDTLSYRIDEPSIPAGPPTKREMLRLIMKVYDPLGLVSHIAARGKVLLQRVWEAGTGWDEQIPQELHESWQEWIELMKQIPDVKVPRLYATNTDGGTIDLHVFTDASNEAMAATAYLRIENGDDVQVVQVMAKVRVMPVKPLTIPRAELVAALLGARLAQTILQHHKLRIRKTYFWTDSKCVLAWLRSRNMRHTPFVKYRVAEILDLTSAADWRYIPSDLNVADDGTKIPARPLETNARWFTGPAFLTESEMEWPHESTAMDFVGHLEVQEEVEPEQPSVSDPIVFLTETHANSDWDALVDSVMALQENDGVGVADYTTAELRIFAAVQSLVYPQELRALQAQGEVRPSSPIYRLSPFLGPDGLIRMRSRLEYSDKSYAARFPVILPNNHPAVLAYVNKIHRANFHQGDNTIIASIREQVWIIAIRTVVKRVKSACEICQILRKQPASPLMAPLPSFRTEVCVKPFFHTGVDVCGPFMIRTAPRRAAEKRWVILFTCMVTRAIHLDVLDSLTTDDCLVAIRDFVNLRGYVKHLYSDCGTNFAGAHNVYNQDLRMMVARLAIPLARVDRIEWHFNPGFTPQWGGAWERLIRVVKECLKAAMMEKDDILSIRVFRSTLLEVADRVNSRPLTELSEDPDDLPPLTPNDFLFLHRAGTDNQRLVDYPLSAPLKSMYRQSLHKANEIWARFVNEYTPLMAVRPKWRKDVANLEVGDKVLVSHPTEPRRSWKMAIVQEVHPGKDGRVRAVTIKEEGAGPKRRTAHGLIKMMGSRQTGDGGEDVPRSPRATAPQL